MRYMGYQDGVRSFSVALRHMLHTLIPGPRVPQAVTPFGDYIEITVGVLGPILFALGALAVPARIRR